MGGTPNDSKPTTLPIICRNLGLFCQSLLTRGDTIITYHFFCLGVFNIITHPTFSGGYGLVTHGTASFQSPKNSFQRPTFFKENP